MNLLRKLFIICILAFQTGLLKADVYIDSLFQDLQKFETSPKLYAENQLILVRELRKRRFKADSLLQAAIHHAQTHQLAYYEAIFTYEQFYYGAREHKLRENSEELLDFLDSMALIMPQHPDVTFYAQNGRTWYLRAHGKYEEAMEMYYESLDLIAKHQLDEFYSDTYIRMGLTALSMENYYGAIEYFNLALKQKNVNYIYVYANLPSIYLELEDWEKVLEFSTKSYELCQKKNQRNAEVFSANYMGIAYMRLGRYEEARQILELTWEKISNSEIKRWDAWVLSTLIELYTITDDLDAAIAAEKWLPNIKHKNQYTVLLNNLGTVYRKKKNFAKAIEYCNQSREILAHQDLNNSTALNKMNACNCLHKTHTQLNNITDAYEALLCYNEAKNHLEYKKNTLSITKALKKEELAKQKKILKLEQEQKEAIYKEQLARYRLGGILSLIILGLGTFTFFQLRKRSQKIESQNKVISHSLAEKETLLKEIHHRVKNNLQVVSGLLKWQSSHIKDDAALSAINEGQNRVQSMALIHQRLYQSENLKGIKMDEYIKRLTESLFHSYNIKPGKISLTTEIENIDLDIDTVIPMGLILNELISNALKHAFNDCEEGKIKVKLFLDKNTKEIALCVEDNGPGMPLQSGKQKTSFGWELIETLTDKLDGHLNIDNSNGTIIQLLFKNYKIA